jgi:hypothetical protein
MDIARKFGMRLRDTVAAMLLLLIAMHAMIPASPPLERTSGSAFSASTVDVSIMRSRGFEAVKRVAGIVPVPPVAIVYPVFSCIHAIALAPQPFAWPHAIGPPWHSIASSPLAPRAPPAA